MKKIISISTKKGDKGESCLANGIKLPKNNIIFEVLGTLDELNSYLGLVVVKMKDVKKMQIISKVNSLKSKNSFKNSPKISFDSFIKNTEFLSEIQNTLFYLGAELAGSTKVKLSKSKLLKLEKESNSLQKKMADNWITKFVMPGGTELGAYLDITRTVSRRLERLIVSLSQKKKVSELILQYVNRLSDYLFILRCFVNDSLSAEEKLFKSEDS